MRTESCLNLNLSRDLLQALSMCPKVQKLSQPAIEHLVSTGLPHLARLSGVARVLVPALPGIKRLQKIIYTQMQRAMLAQVSPEQALTAAASEWNRYARSRWPEAAGNS